MTGVFDPGAYKDGYREALVALIDDKVAGRAPSTVPIAEAPPLIDLAGILAASVKRQAQITKSRKRKVA
jgi:DNA end-binding protein Ku